MKKTIAAGLITGLAILTCNLAAGQKTPEGTAWVTSHGYSGCVELTNGTVRVVLEPNCGGRVLEYSLNGKNALHVDPVQDGWVPTPGGKNFDPTGGRCDFGPEMKAPSHRAIWSGPWKAEITGPRAARMTSVEDSSSGVQLVREFRLEKGSCHLSFTQTIKNISNSPKEYNHWSRTFAEGGGICLVPLGTRSRFPLGYIIYGPGPVLNYRHDEHPNVRVRDGFLELLGTPPQPKFGVDSYEGWLGYITRSNLLFVKKFPVYPERAYGEVAAYTISLWYNKEEMCELEPIGPTEFLKPGQSASFTEDWWLFPYDYPADKTADLAALKDFVGKNTK
ncbi:hypothetical protein LLG96_20065 [bacterium]|nr:hypothetical protein [bacterium]